MPMPASREAFFPENGVPIPNRFGIALGFFIETAGKFLVVLPGVPRELENLFETRVQKLILKKFGGLRKDNELTVSMIGLDESQMMSRLGKQFFKARCFEFGSYPMGGYLVLHLKSKSKSLLQVLKKELLRRFKREIYSFSDELIEEVVANRLIKKRLIVSVAESCTGGLLAKRLTDIF